MHVFLELVDKSHNYPQQSSLFWCRHRLDGEKYRNAELEEWWQILEKTEKNDKILKTDY